MKKLQGAFTALITPMFEDGEIDYEGWRKLIQFQLEQGISGLVPLGTTGETPTLDETPEEDKLIEIVISEVKSYKEKYDYTTLLDEEYPEHLKREYKPPFVLKKRKKFDD